MKWNVEVTHDLGQASGFLWKTETELLFTHWHEEKMKHMKSGAKPEASPELGVFVQAALRGGQGQGLGGRAVCMQTHACNLHATWVWHFVLASHHLSSSLLLLSFQNRSSQANEKGLCLGTKRHTVVTYKSYNLVLWHRVIFLNKKWHVKKDLSLRIIHHSFGGNMSSSGDKINEVFVSTQN